MTHVVILMFRFCPRSQETGAKLLPTRGLWAGYSHSTGNSTQASWRGRPLWGGLRGSLQEQHLPWDNGHSTTFGISTQLQQMQNTLTKMSKERTRDKNDLRNLLNRRIRTDQAPANVRDLSGSSTVGFDYSRLNHGGERFEAVLQAHARQLLQHKLR